MFGIQMLKRSFTTMSNILERNVVIRKAKPEDMTPVFEMIKQLAVFQKMEDQVKINENVLIKDGFETDPPRFGCFVAEVEDKSIVGYALYYPCYSTWLGKSLFFEDLYVKENHRRSGIGQQLMVEVVRVANKIGERMDFHVLSSNPAIKLYKKLGAKNMSTTEHWTLFRLEKDKLKEVLHKFG